MTVERQAMMGRKAQATSVSCQLVIAMSTRIAIRRRKM